MVWIIVYIIGAIATAAIYAYMDAKYGNPDQTRENAQGRKMAITLWPIVLPFIIINCHRHIIHIHITHECEISGPIFTTCTNKCL